MLLINRFCQCLRQKMSGNGHEASELYLNLQLTKTDHPPNTTGRCYNEMMNTSTLPTANGNQWENNGNAIECIVFQINFVEASYCFILLYNSVLC